MKAQVIKEQEDAHCTIQESNEIQGGKHKNTSYIGM